ncbi:phosphoribosylanthranilate isomerase [bacterium]|nr:phosphoribosylanthranilate isomerase [bacterium]
MPAHELPAPEMFQIKICGLRDFENAVAVAHSGADAIGLNFFPRSKRFVDTPVAEQIANAVRGEVQLVGLFVNASLQEILDIHQRIGLDWIQLHGDESAKFAQQVYSQTGAPILAASRGTLSRWEDLPDGFRPQGFLLDAAVPGSYGGTGQVADWSLAKGWQENPQLENLVLAGGLTPENVAQAIAQVRPTAVDVAGGVELSGQPGIKDLVKVGQFIAEARKAFASIR